MEKNLLREFKGYKFYDITLSATEHRFDIEAPDSGTDFSNFFNATEPASLNKVIEKGKEWVNAKLKAGPEAAPSVQYSDEDLSEFKTIIENKIDAAEKELTYLQSKIDDPEFQDDKMSKDQMTQMGERQKTFIQNLKEALGRIENKTYGICRVTGKLIDKARLLAVPHATLSIEAKRESDPPAPADLSTKKSSKKKKPTIKETPIDPPQKCRVCGCTEDNCAQCIEKTGGPCHWIEPDLCSACVEKSEEIIDHENERISIPADLFSSLGNKIDIPGIIEGKVKHLPVINNKTYCLSGGVGAGNGNGYTSIDAYEAVIIDNYKGDKIPLNYGDHFREVDKQERERSYDGLKIEHKREKYVLVGPEITFLMAAAEETETIAPPSDAAIKIKDTRASQQLSENAPTVTGDSFFFQHLAMMGNVDINMRIMKVNGSFTIGITPGNAVKGMMPTNITGTPQEFDNQFLTVIMPRLKEIKGLVHNIKEVKEAAEKKVSPVDPAKTTSPKKKPSKPVVKKPAPAKKEVKKAAPKKPVVIKKPIPSEKVKKQIEKAKVKIEKKKEEKAPAVQEVSLFNQPDELIEESNS